jgi:aminoglycoside 3-N-acetyltransferase
MLYKETIINDLQKIGVNKGDLLYVTADLAKVGYFNGNRQTTSQDWLDIFDEILGPNGTLITSAYSETFFRFDKKKDKIFTRFAKSNSGSFSNILIKDTNSFRSKHPTNSCIARGKLAEEIVNKHDIHSLSYSILGEIINRGGKFLLLGTIDDKNTPQAMHYAQELLGYTKWSPYKYLYQIKYELNGKLKIYTKKDFGGCSKGGRNLYGYLFEKNLININNIGNAQSALMPAKESFDIIYSVLKQKKNIIQCTNKQCIDCYGNFNYNGLSSIIFIFSYFFYKIFPAKNKGSL